MNHLQFAVLLGMVFVVVGDIIFCRCRYRSYHRDQKVKEVQIKHRIEKNNRLRVDAVADLEKELKDGLMAVTQHYSGVEALHRARRVVETIYYTWISDYMSEFYVGEPPPRIIGMRNGFFQYELPDHLKQFTKGKRK